MLIRPCAHLTPINCKSAETEEAFADENHRIICDLHLKIYKSLQILEVSFPAVNAAAVFSVVVFEVDEEDGDVGG